MKGIEEQLIEAAETYTDFLYDFLTLLYDFTHKNDLQKIFTWLHSLKWLPHFEIDFNLL